ncbi:MAG: hypothetical protein ABTQ32_29520 [Myxococcaceae bacterium]
MVTLWLAAVLGAGPWTCEREDARIRNHLEDALAQLKSTSTDRLSATQRAGRAEVISLLEGYRAEGRFPRSDGVAGPVFVDETGSHCAMGALLAATGARELVERIRQHRNLETVGTLANEPGLGEWLDAHGMTAEEAALVQPTYFHCWPATTWCEPRATERWLVVTSLRADGGHQPFLIAESSPPFCRGEPYVSRVGSYEFSREDLREYLEGTPAGAVYSEWGSVFATQDGQLPLVEANCGRAMTLSPTILTAGNRNDCIKRAAQLDVRWLIPTCSQHTTPENSLACHPNGRRKSSLLPPRGTLQTRLEAEFGAGFFEDAGITPAMFAAAEAIAWDESDDGGAAVSPADRSRYVRWIPGTDTSCLAARDAGADGGRDAGATDAGLDAGVDAGLDAGVSDAGAERVPDAGSPAPPPIELPAVSSGEGVASTGCTAVGGELSLLVVALLRRRR